MTNAKPSSAELSDKAVGNGDIAERRLPYVSSTDLEVERRCTVARDDSRLESKCHISEPAPLDLVAYSPPMHARTHTRADQMIPPAPRERQRDSAGVRGPRQPKSHECRVQANVEVILGRFSLP